MNLHASQSRVAGPPPKPHPPGLPQQRDIATAALRGDTALLIRLLDAGADPNLPDDQGRISLIEASFGDHLDAVLALLDRGADPNLQDAEGWTPLMEAASKGRLNIVKALLAAHADPHLQTREGRTALAVCARDHARITRLLRLTNVR